MEAKPIFTVRVRGTENVELCELFHLDSGTEGDGEIARSGGRGWRWEAQWEEVDLISEY